MTLRPSLRKAGLVAHVSTSVGWLGAVAAFLVLAVVALHGSDVTTVRSLYVAMEVLGTAVLVPLALASLATGVFQALSSTWGLLQHWWVVVKLGITLVATVILLAYTSTLALLADAARDSTSPPGVLPSGSPVLHAGAALVVLLAAAVLSIYKPRGLTRYGWRRQQAARQRG